MNNTEGTRLQQIIHTSPKTFQFLPQELFQLYVFRISRTLLLLFYLIYLYINSVVHFVLLTFNICTLYNHISFYFNSLSIQRLVFNYVFYLVFEPSMLKKKALTFTFLQPYKYFYVFLKTNT